MKKLIIVLACFSLTTVLNAQNITARSESGLDVDFSQLDYEVVWISPEISIDQLDAKNVEIKVGIKTNAKIEKITIYINGLPVSNNRGFKTTKSSPDYAEMIEHSLFLNSGTNEVKIEALADNGFVMMSERSISIADGAYADIVSRRNFALMFGTSDYEEWSDLTNPVNDARDVARELKESYGFQVELIENATQEQILLKLREYAERSYLPKDQLFVFFAGHGHFDEINGEGYIVTKESKVNDRTFSSYLSHNILRNRINNIPSEHILLTMDACFGGTFDPTIARSGSRGNDLYDEVGNLELIERKMRYKTRQFLTSGGKEYVPDGRPGMNSPFASKLLEALRSNGGPDGLLTIADIKGYVELITPEPRLGSFGSNEAGSDFVFERKN